MKILFALPLIALQFSIGDPTPFFSLSQKNDTTIVHILDGNSREWPSRKFMTDIDTEIRFAVDNDKQMLFLVLKIPDTAMQSRIIHQGMSVYIDSKGKKKESRGVEFPVKMENNTNPANALNSMKLFGFTELAPFVQSIQIPGTVNIAAARDSSSVLTIEYNIPLSFLDKSIVDLNNRNISIGWKINHNVIKSNNNNPSPATTTSTTIQARPAGSGSPNYQTPTSVKGTNSFSGSNPGKTQSFWTSHTIIL